jgi:hypothetical protein
MLPKQIQTVQIHSNILTSLCAAIQHSTKLDTAECGQMGLVISVLKNRVPQKKMGKKDMIGKNTLLGNKPVFCPVLSEFQKNRIKSRFFRSIVCFAGFAALR